MCATRLDSVKRPEKWTAGIDYFRWKVDRVCAAGSALARIRELQTEDTQRGSNLTPWKFEGYEGLQTDSIRWGKKGGDLLWESSGKAAHVTLGHMEPSVGYAKRIDLQLTFSLSHALPHYGTSLMQRWTRMIRTSRTPQRLLGVSTRTDGLWLGTVGRRTSKGYLRLYDKGIEQKVAPSGKIWRLELEAKYSHARTLWQDHSTNLQNPRYCASYVQSYLQRSDLCSPCAELDLSPVDMRLGKDESTTVGKLALWIHHTVRPTIPRLLTVFTVAEVLEMLNLSDVAAPTGRDNAHARQLESDRARRRTVAGNLSLYNV